MKQYTLHVLFSPCREKSTKRAPRKESTHGTFLTDPFPLSACHFARRNGFIRCSVAVCHRAAMAAERRHCGYLPVRQKQRGEFRADGAPPSVRVFGFWRPSARSALGAEWRRGRAHQGDGFPRKGPWVSSLGGVLLVLFFRHGKKST